MLSTWTGRESITRDGQKNACQPTLVPTLIGYITHDLKYLRPVTRITKPRHRFPIFSIPQLGFHFLVYRPGKHVASLPNQANS